MQVQGLTVLSEALDMERMLGARHRPELQVLPTRRSLALQATFTSPSQRDLTVQGADDRAVWTQQLHCAAVQSCVAFEKSSMPVFTALSQLD